MPRLSWTLDGYPEPTVRRPRPHRRHALPMLMTERLRLRPWRDDDLDALAAIFAEPAVWRYPVGRGFTRAETAAFLDRMHASWAEHGFGLWAAELLETDTLVGFIGLSIPTFLPEVLPAVEVGWRLRPDHWGQGLATEGGEASLRFGFEVLGLDRIVSIAEPDNIASIRVMQHLGMTHERDAVHPRYDLPVVVYEITAAAWRG